MPYAEQVPTEIDELHVPLITIPTPIYTNTHRHGIEAHNNWLRSRASKKELEVIQRAAKELDMPVSYFIRWCTHRAALDVLHRRKLKAEELRHANADVSRGRAGT